MGMIRVGKVAYLNTLPLFYSLEGFEIVEGHPPDLVKKLRGGDIDAGIVSSVEYFFNPEDYYVLPGVSISSRGKVCSVLLLSHKPIHEVLRVRITPRSLTSRYLVLYILKEIYGITPEEVPYGEDALLSIGDEALRLKHEFPHVYDLGEEWFKHTGLPFVFALFLVRREVPENQVLRLIERLRVSIEDFFRDLESGRLHIPGDKEFLRDYFTSCIDYSLGEDHMRSLEIFFRFVEKETGRPAPKTISLFPLL